MKDELVFDHKGKCLHGIGKCPLGSDREHRSQGGTVTRTMTLQNQTWQKKKKKKDVQLSEGSIKETDRPAGS